MGFDWEERSQVWEKVKEEIAEFESEVETMDKEKAEAEFGDVMFSLINAARLYKINPDKCTGAYQPEVYPPLQLSGSTYSEGRQEPEGYDSGRNGCDLE